MYDPRIPTSKAACMRRLLLLVGAGYTSWTGGSAPCAKAQRFAAKMADLYPVDQPANRRSEAKVRGIANVHLTLYPADKAPDRILYWLMATPGKGLIHEREQLADAEATPLTWRDQYHITRYERSAKKGGGSRWTWAMQGPYYRTLLATAKDAADAGEPALRDLFTRLGRMPMFPGIRAQVDEIDRHAATTWGKRRKSPYPRVLPDPLPVMSNSMEVFGDLTLSALVERMARDAEARAARADEQASAVLAERDEASST